MSTIVKRTLTATQLQNQKIEIAIEGKTSALANAITEERASRESADFTLTQNLQTETANRTSADSTITQNLNDEISARNAANNQLSALITAEANTRKIADDKLTENLNKESENREKADNTLQNNIDAESTARQNADDDLLKSLNTEISNRTSANTTLQNNLNAESTARTNADDQLAKLISELQAAVADDSAIEKINKDIADLKSADSTLQHNIDAEINARTSADANLKTSIDDEISARKAADTTLQNNINAEITARGTAITNLESSLTKKINDVQSNLNTEINNRKAGDTGVNDEVLAQINSLKTALDNEVASRANELATMKAELEAEIARLRDELAETALSQAQSTGFSQNGTLTYNGNKQTVSIKNYDETIHVLGGTTNATTAGNYTATVSPAPGFTWYDGSTDAKNVSWSIGAKLINKPTATTTSFNYDGNNKTLSVNGYDSTTMTQSGTVTASATGSYSVSYSLKNTTNYHWADNSTTKVTINWSIGSASISKPTASSTSFTYNGSAQTLDVANYNSDYMSQTGTVSATDAGSYSVVYKLKSGYKWSDNSTSDVTINWNIAVLKLTKPTSSNTSLTFNNNTQTLSVSNYNSSYMNRTGDYSAKNAGNYSVTYSLKSTTNTAWSDNSTSNVQISWSIAVLKLSKPTSSTTSFTYNGSSKTLSVSNYNSSYMTRTGTYSASAVGDYTVTYTLKDTTNTKWSDNSTAAVNINWSIVDTTVGVAKPTATNTSFTFNNASQTLEISGYNEDAMEQTGKITAKAAGSYSVVYKLKSGYKWADNSTADVTINWSIAALKLAKPTASTTSFVYNGNSKALSVSNYKSTYMDKTGTLTAKEAGNYTTVYSLKSTTNTTWEDDSTNDVSIDWEITKAQVSFPYFVYASSVPKYSEPFEYDGTEKKVSIFWQPCQNYATYTSDIEPVEYKNSTIFYSATEVGAHNITCTFKEPQNCVWKETGSSEPYTLTWEIKEKKIPVPTADASTIQFASGMEHFNFTVSNFDENTMVKSGTFQADSSGTYTCQITAKDNYIFENGLKSIDYSWRALPYYFIEHQTEDVKVLWSMIKPKDQDWICNPSIPFYSILFDTTISPSSGERYTFEIADKMEEFLERTIRSDCPYEIDLDNRVLVGNLIHREAIYYKDYGPYYITFKIKDAYKGKVFWHDGSSANVTVTVNAPPYQLTTLPYLNATAFAYDGKSKTVKISSYGSDSAGNGAGATMYSDTSSVMTATDVGEYTVRVSSKPTPGNPNHALAVWWDAEATNDYKPRTYEMKWAITTNASLAKPVITGAENGADGSIQYDITVTSAKYTYTGKEITPVLQNFLTTSMTISDDSVLSATEIKRYEIKITPKSGFAWADGTNSTITLHWRIDRIPIPAVSFKGSEKYNIIRVPYTGEAYKALDCIENFDPSLMKLFVAGANISGTPIDGSTTTKLVDATTTIKDVKWNTTYGTPAYYFLTLTLKDSTHYEFAGVSSSLHEDGYNMFFYIMPIEVETPEYSIRKLAYNGNTQTVITNADKTINNAEWLKLVTVEGTASAKNVGSYTMKFTLKDNNNYIWKGETHQSGIIQADWSIVNE